MKISLKYLGKLVDLNGLSAKEIADRLTFAGVEVECINYGISINNLVIGQVKTCEKVENSDHLHLCVVDAGEKYGLVRLICGAKNVRVGLKVIVALPGAHLPHGEIKVSNIHGIESNGMLCSLLELGVPSSVLRKEQTEGIEELDEDAVVGNEDVCGYLGLDDESLEIKLLANRSDLYSLFNFAKEIKTLFNRPLNLPNPKVVGESKTDFVVDSKTMKCTQFSALEVHDIKVMESPKEIQKFLSAFSIRPINNIVDIGNVAMLLTGQPLHMYDLDKLTKRELIVRDDIESDFIALDEKTYKVQKGDICITCDNKIMCLGGVMGSLSSAVDVNTKNILVEAANFNFAQIRRTSLRLNLTSDSSLRFSKGINPNQYDFVLSLVNAMLSKYADAKENLGIKTYLANSFKNTIISLNYRYINNRLGTNFTKDEIVQALEDDFMKVNVKGDNLVVEVPSSRIDIKEKVDLSEEVIRILGFDKISDDVDLTLSLGGICEDKRLKMLVSSYLLGAGLDQQLSYTLVSKSVLGDFNLLGENDECYEVLHPLTSDHQYVRTSLLGSLIEILKYNLNHGNDNLAFFEVSDIFKKGKKSIELAITLSGLDNHQEKLHGQLYNFYHMKGLIEGLLSLFRIAPQRCAYSNYDGNILHPGRSAVLKIDGQKIAVFGEVHPKIRRDLIGDKSSVVVLEMDLSKLFAIKTGNLKLTEISRFPSSKRDLAFILENKYRVGEIISVIKRAGKGVVSDVEVFDVYEGKGIQEGYKSVAFTLTYKASDHTLKDEEIIPIENNIIQEIAKKFNGELRK